jgi:membrane-associated HD superfamily phosphohydrolase
MTTSLSKASRIRKAFFLFFLLIMVSITIWLLVIISISTAPSVTDIQEGDVATQDIVAPQAVNFTSDVLTEIRRQDIANSITPRYTLPDTSVARRQLEHLRSTLEYINSVRSDPYASTDQKMTDLAALQDVQLGQDTAAAILALSETRWQAVQQEAISVLERVMRNTIRDDQIEGARQSVPNLVSLALPEEQADIAAELAAAFIAPNSVYSESLTESARQQAMESIEPVLVSYAPGETVVRSGQRVTGTQIEALEYLGLVQSDTQWQDLLGDGILVILCVGLILIYFRRDPTVALDNRKLLIFIGMFIVFLVGARFVLPLP